MGPEILAFVSHCSANFQTILDCFIPNFKLRYEDSENIKADCAVVFNLNQIFFFLGGGGGGETRGSLKRFRKDNHRAEKFDTGKTFVDDRKNSLMENGFKSIQ